MKKVLMTILVFGLLSAGNIQAFALPKADLFEIKEGKAILEFENSAVIQDEVKLWLRSITGFTNRTNILEFQNGYCLRIPISPMQVKNKWIDASIQDVFLMLDPTHKPVLLIFDVNWPKRYFVDFSHDIRPFLKKLGIWETVKSSFPPPTKTPK
ncbi:hypothetical protein BSK66_25040 [Paenibacillus odorifer]|uniref:hypothetical protein n=1 Tax=Paenibacillus TaxID=44249 RepID=UPI0003E29ABA|nr:MULTISPECIES: hypothetical protein [Paenibacillus]ETT54324.1 hypothetical protein C171_20394 [Paenibacillus sp. FSL H8-237]OME50729.1 hypothetical protein BSK66_25040 [Paenibacillus odorifer]